MTQQGKITAALTRAGIPEAAPWSAAETPHPNPNPNVDVENTAPPAAIDLAHSDAPQRNELTRTEAEPNGADPNNEEPSNDGLNRSAPVSLMKGVDDPVFVISFRSQKEIYSGIARKSAAMLWGGAAITLVGVCGLLAQLAIH
jgi:hypothetical protein